MTKKRNVMQNLGVQIKVVNYLQKNESLIRANKPTWVDLAREIERELSLEEFTDFNLKHICKSMDPPFVWEMPYVPNKGINISDNNRKIAEMRERHDQLVMQTANELGKHTTDISQLNNHLQQIAATIKSLKDGSVSASAVDAKIKAVENRIGIIEDHLTRNTTDSEKMKVVMDRLSNVEDTINTINSLMAKVDAIASTIDARIKEIEAEAKRLRCGVNAACHKLDINPAGAGLPMFVNPKAIHVAGNNKTK